MRKHIRMARLGGSVAAAIVLMLVAACTESMVSGGADVTPTGTTSAATPTTVPATPTTTASYPVTVYFSKHPDSDSDVSAVFPVSRTSPTLGVATYALKQLIAGPTAAEASAGFYTPLTASLSGSSSCGGADFTIALDSKGTVPAAGTATMRFCRATSLAGDLTGARISAEINATLKQFANIRNVVILTRDGGCFDDLSGMNACLH